MTPVQRARLHTTRTRIDSAYASLGDILQTLRGESPECTTIGMIRETLADMAGQVDTLINADAAKDTTR